MKQVTPDAFVSNPLPVSNYKATIKVTAKGDGSSTITWSGSYTPEEGKEKAASEALIGASRSRLDRDQGPARESNGHCLFRLAALPAGRELRVRGRPMPENVQPPARLNCAGGNFACPRQMRNSDPLKSLLHRFSEIADDPPVCRAGAASPVSLLRPLQAPTRHRSTTRSSKASCRPMTGLIPRSSRRRFSSTAPTFLPEKSTASSARTPKRRLKAFGEAKGLAVGKQPLTPEIWAALLATSSDPVIVDYKITEKDVKGPFLQKLPAKMEDLKGLKSLDYTSPREAIAEKFHMSEALARGAQPRQEIRRGRPNDLDR